MIRTGVIRTSRSTRPTDVSWPCHALLDCTACLRKFIKTVRIIAYSKEGARVLFPPHKQSTPCWQDCGAWSLLEVQAGVGVALGLLALWPPTVTHAVVVRPGGKLCIWSA